MKLYLIIVGAMLMCVAFFVPIHIVVNVLIGMLGVALVQISQAVD